MKALAACLALSALLFAGCSVGPRPGNWGSVSAVPNLSLVDRLVSLPGGAVVASGLAPDKHVTAVVFDSARSTWLPAVESPLITGLRDTDILARGELLVTSPQGNWRFRPSNGTWRPAAAMNHPRSVYASSNLADGRLLACGGTDQTHLALASCEIYDPPIDHWAPSASMSTPRFGPLAATLPDGRVFVTGGAFNPTQDGSFDVNLDPLDTSEIFNPATAAFGPAPPYLDPVTNPTLVSLPNGHLLAIGGRQGSRVFTQTTQELDPDTGRWSIRASPTAFGLGTVLPDGRVLVIGAAPGESFFGVGGGAIYDPAIDLWTPMTPAPAGYSPGEAARLPDGRVLTLSFGDHPSSAVFDPQALPPLPGRDLPLGSREAVLGLAALVGALVLLVLARVGWRRRG
jgi:Kelch motif